MSASEALFHELSTEKKLFCLQQDNCIESEEEITTKVESTPLPWRSFLN